MAAHFTIRAEPSRDLIRITMSGFFTPDDIQAFYDARAIEHARLTCGPNQHVTLNDLSGMKPPPGMVQKDESYIGPILAYRSRKLAFVVDRTLARSQLMRALNGRTAKCFDDRVAAERWLFAHDSEMVAA